MLSWTATPHQPRGVDSLGVAGKADAHCPTTLPTLSCQPVALPLVPRQLEPGCSPDPAWGGLSLGLGLVWSQRGRLGQLGSAAPSVT